MFDSGVGGLTVLKALAAELPHEHFVYLGDTARLPYGTKSPETVARYALQAAEALCAYGVKCLVIACNTASALALEEIRGSTAVPVLGVIETGANEAASSSKTREILVIGTDATIASHAYAAACRERGLRALEKACPLLVPLVEEGWVEHAVTEQVARIYLAEAFADGFRDADTLVLACTHYPLLMPVLRRVAPEHVRIVDSAESTAHAVAAHLREPISVNTSEERRSVARLKFFATDSTEKFRRLGQRFLGRAIDTVQHVDLKE